MKSCKTGLLPKLCRSSDGSIHHHHFACPVCKNKVGGFLATGGGEDDWTTHQDKFCCECGQAIDWSDIKWESIYGW